MNASRGTPLAEYRACSACAGDYEDPDRTAWTDEAVDREAGEEDTSEQRAPAEELPASRE